MPWVITFANLLKVNHLAGASGGRSLPEEKKPAQSIKVTDKRLFTPEGEIRDEYRDSVRPGEPGAPRREPEPAKAPEPAPSLKKERSAAPNPQSETLFMSLIELLAYQAIMSLRSQQFDGAKQLIDIVDMLSDKTDGNLTESEKEFLESRRGELKLAFVQLTKRI